MKRRILYILLAIVLVAQFFQPHRGVPPIDPANDMLVMTEAPDDIRTLVQGACYDCHSYNTTYPWYSHVTPMNFWLQDHINEGREKMNFSHWNMSASQKHAHEAGEEVQEGEMPIDSYTWIHGEARLDASQRNTLATWFNANMPIEQEEDQRGEY
ncbi:MAG: heme-binding domain-containing protein [Flavobacteriales bacterium]|nr:heme-binding domain-containing protein [Flavobacteriales bacterium]